MSNEIKAVSTTVSTNVDKLWQKPLSVHSNGAFISVHPPGAILKVTAGTVRHIGTIPLINFGYVVRFSNSMTAQAQSVGLTKADYEVLFTYAIINHEGDAVTNIKIHLDEATGTFIAERPCYAAIRIKIHKPMYDSYAYTPELKVFPQGGGMATFGMAVAMLLSPDKGTMPQIQTCDIPAPPPNINDPGAFERFRMTVPTVITPEGEWHKPKDFEKDTYDQANAYGTGKAGPSNESGAWVLKEHPLEIGTTKQSGDVSYQKFGKLNVLGPSDYVPEIALVIPKRPDEFPEDSAHPENDSWKLASVTTEERKKDWEKRGYTVVIKDQNVG